MFLVCFLHQGAMATAKTGSFYLTETISLTAASPSGTRVQGEIDLGAYVQVSSGTAVSIDQVDFIFQVGDDFGYDAGSMLTDKGAIGCQVSDLNPGTLFLRADDQSLVASGSLVIDVTNGIVSHETDIYPDSFGPAGLSDSFLVVNDSLFVVAGNDGNAIGTGEVNVTARIRARIVKLSTKDWMAIAIQSTASDN
jgi:hypothetical protein